MGTWGGRPNVTDLLVRIAYAGGIQRYLETFPDGGFFKGKNFVFDERLAVGGNVSKTVIGTCMKCGKPTEDYGALTHARACSCVGERGGGGGFRVR